MKPYSYHITQSRISKSVKRTEGSFRLLVESVSRYAIILLDPAGYISTWNAGAEKIKGYSAKEIIGKHISIFYTPEEAANGEPQNNLEKAARDGNLETEGLRVRKDGSQFWANVAFTALYGDNGELKGFAKVTHDISERKKFEEMQSRQERLTRKKLTKSLKETSDYKYALDECCIIAITDNQGIIKHVNKNFCEISKYSETELIGKNHRIVNSGYHSKEFMQNLWETIRNGNIWRGEIKNKAKDGSFYWVNTTIVPFLNEQNEPYQYVAIRSDITKRKKAEELKQQLETRLKEQTEKLYDVFDKMLDGFIMLDKDFRYTFANKKIGAMLGCDPASLIGQNVWDKFPDSINSATYHAFNKAMSAQQYISNIDFYAPLDLWQENHIYPSSNGLSVFIRDITVQKRAEQLLQRNEARFRRIFDSNMVGFIFWDSTGEISESNDRFLELTGYTRHDLNERKIRWKDITPPEYADLVMEKLDQLKVTDVTEPFEEEFVRKDGTRTPVLIRAATIGKSNRGQGVAYIMDITERKEAEKKMLLLNEELEERVKERTHELQLVNNELEAFSYSVSHDLRAPLRAISGFATILEEDHVTLLDKEGMRLLKKVQENAGKMGRLINDLLAFSRLGRKEINKSSVKMDVLINDVLREMEKATTHKAEVKIEKLHPVMADYALIVQVMTNLISNAIKYSSKKENPVIKVSSYKKDNEIVYSVNDNGAGFEMEYVNKLFGVFQRLHRADEFEGTGVGLAIVQRIITKHGGKVWAEGEPDKGATFYFSLPIA
jgi:PAS domain S-box-containing protein